MNQSNGVGLVMLSTCPSTPSTPDPKPEIRILADLALILDASNAKFDAVPDKRGGQESPHT